MPRGVQHYFKNVSNEPTRLLLLYTPGGLEQWFLDVGKPCVGNESKPPESSPKTSSRPLPQPRNTALSLRRSRSPSTSERVLPKPPEELTTNGVDMPRIFLAIVGLAYILLAAWCSLMPDKTSKAVGFTLQPGSGQSEFDRLRRIGTGTGHRFSVAAVSTNGSRIPVVSMPVGSRLPCGISDSRFRVLSWNSDDDVCPRSDRMDHLHRSRQLVLGQAVKAIRN